VVAQEADREEGSGFEGGKDVCEASGRGEQRNVERGGVSRLNGGAVWEADVDRVVGGDRFEKAGRALDHEVVAGGACVGYG
jgi:hypothetical protein